MTKKPTSEVVHSGQVCAVITGDVVASSASTPTGRRQLLDTMKQASNRLRHILKTAMPLDVDIYSGDAWQILLTKPHLALRAAVFYRAFLRSHPPQADTRLVIAIAPVGFVPGKRVSEGEGEAFRLSGRTLLEIEKPPLMRFRCSDADREMPWQALTTLLDMVITRDWTPPRALAVTGALQGMNQTRIARLWTPAITQSGASRHLAGAGWDAVSATVRLFEDAWSGPV